MQEKLKIGEILVRTGLIQESQLRSALGEQARWGGRIGVTLVKLGFLLEEDLVRALGSHFGIPVVRLQGKRIQPEVLSLLPADFTEKHGCLPLFIHWENGMEVLYLGMEDPGDLAVLDDVAFRTGLRVRPVLVGPVQIRDAIEEFYRGGPSRPELPPEETVPGPPEEASEPVHADDTPPLPVPAAPEPAPPAAQPPAVAPPPVAPPTVAPPTVATPAAPAPSPPPPGPPAGNAFAVPSAPPSADGDATQVYTQSPVSDPSDYEQTFEPAGDDGLPEIEVAELDDDFEAALAHEEALGEATELAATIEGVEELVTDSDTSPELVPFADDVPYAGEPVEEEPAAPAPAAAPTPVPEPASAPIAPSPVPDPAAAPLPAAPAAHPPTPEAQPPPPPAPVVPPAPEPLAVAALEPPSPAAPEPPVAPPVAPEPPVAPPVAPEPPATAFALPALESPSAQPPAAAPPSFAGVDPNGETRSSLDAALEGDRRSDGAGGKPRQVATRDILRAVTQLLIDAGIFTREELVEKVKVVGTDRRSHD